MTTITLMLGGGHVLLELSYDIQELFEERLSDEPRLFLSILRLVCVLSRMKAGRTKSGRGVVGPLTTPGRSCGHLFFRSCIASRRCDTPSNAWKAMRTAG